MLGIRRQLPRPSDPSLLAFVVGMLRNSDPASGESGEDILGDAARRAESRPQLRLVDALRKR